MSNWQILDSTASDEAVINTVIGVFTELYQTYFIHELLVNHQLPIEVRAFRHTDIWRIFLLLTPWTLARIFLPEHKPTLILPTGWQAEERLQAPLLVIGPAISLPILGGKEKAHLNYHAKLGHYLIQPLIQSMAQFNTPQAAFDAWNEVITTRNRVIVEQQRRCDWQQEVSRREFFAQLRRSVPIKKS
ncbi:MAG: [NiFe]-hydrogenase assembly chaperone HybE [Thioploca sp.]|nr:[NiFe]-hydrogenase assembly chaperone HybE [Thioploca sp.]